MGLMLNPVISMQIGHQGAFMSTQVHAAQIDRQVALMLTPFDIRGELTPEVLEWGSC